MAATTQSTIDRAAPRPGSGGARDRRPPTRRCLVTGERLPSERMLRFVIGPDNVVVPDVEGELPGRGLWLTARRDIVESARTGKRFARAARAAVRTPDDLSERVEDLLARRCLRYLGLARRAGVAASGFQSVRDWLRRDKVAVLLTASDGAQDGAGKLHGMRPELPVIRLFAAGELGAALGRQMAVHVAVAPGRLADCLRRETLRLEGFRRYSDGGSAETAAHTAGKGRKREDGE